jgi:WD40 repeat protein
MLTEGNELAIYDVERSALDKLTATGVVHDITFSPDSQQLIASDSDGNIQVWNLASAQWVDNPVQEYAPAFSLATSSQFLAMASADQIHITGTDNNGGIPPIGGSEEKGLLVFSKDGSLLASPDATGRITIWQYQDGKFAAVASFNKERAVSLAFHPEGTLFAVGTATQVYLMDIGGKELARIPHLDTVNGVSFSADGKYLATASSTLLQIWEIDKIQLIKSEALLPAACSRLFENFDPAQWSTFFGNEKYKTLCDSLAVPE